MGSDDRKKTIILLAFGLLLIGSGVAVATGVVGEPSERYHRVNVSPDGSSFTFLSSEDVAAPSRLRGVDCYPSASSDEWPCRLERLLLNNRTTLRTETNISSPTRFVRLEGRFYRRSTFQYNHTHSETRLVPVTATVVADEIAVPRAALDDYERAVIESGSAYIPIDAQVSTDVLVETDDGYAVIGRGYDRDIRELPPVEVPLIAAGIVTCTLAGLWYRRSQ